MFQDKGVLFVGFFILAALYDTITLPLRILLGFFGAPYEPTNWADLWEDLLNDNSDGGLF